MKYCALGIAWCAILLTAVSCKPTEANYKSAYDAALQKRQEVAEEQMRPATGLLSDDGPQLRVMDGDSIYVLRERLRDLDGEHLRCRWAVAVGMFKMDTNAKAGAAAMASEGFPHAFAAKAAGGRYFTLCDTVASLDDARAVADRFKKSYPGYPYVGLPGAPVLVGL